MSVNLLHFPNEILTKIFYNLSPVDLLSIAKIDSRFEILTCEKEVVWKINFNRTTLISKEDLKQFFLKNRSKNIIHLHIESCCDNERRKIWESCIVKCQNLKSLNIINLQGFTMESIVNIFCHLQNLEEFSWSLLGLYTKLLKTCQEMKAYIARKQLDLTKLRKFTLYFSDESLSYIFIKEFLTHTINLEYLHLHLLHPVLRTLQEDSIHFPLAPILLPKLHSFLVTRDDNDYENKINSINKTIFNFVSNIILHNSNIWRKLHLTSDIVRFMNISLTKKQEILYTLAENNLFLSCNDESDLNNFHLKSNNQQKHLSIQNANISISQLENIFQMNNNVQNLTMKDVYINDLSEMFLEFKNFFLSCQNIVELNFLYTHFHIHDRVLECISYLKELKCLTLQSCAILSQNEKKSTPRSSEDDVIPQKKRRIVLHPDNESLLQPIVNNCVKICKLKINGCVEARVPNSCCNLSGLHITDKDLSSISKLKNLHSLTLKNLPYIRQGNFLQEISTSCKNIKRLILNQIGIQGACSYISSLCFFLRHTLSLIDLVIYHGYLDLNSEMFWTSLTQAKTLERICLKTDLKQTVILGKILLILDQKWTCLQKLLFLSTELKFTPNTAKRAVLSHYSTLCAIFDLSRLSAFHIHAPLYNAESLRKAFKRIIVNKNKYGILKEAIVTENNNFFKTLLSVNSSFCHIHDLCLQ